MIKYNLTLVSIYTLFSVWFFSMRPDYGLASIATFFMLLSLAYLILAVLSIVKHKTPGKLMKIACWVNFAPLILGVIFFSISTLAPSLLYFWDALGDHAALIIFGYSLFAAIGGMAISFVLFAIAYFRDNKVSAAPPGTQSV